MEWGRWNLVGLMLALGLVGCRSPVPVAGGSGRAAAGGRSEATPGGLVLLRRSDDGRFLVTSDGTAWQTGWEGRVRASGWRRGSAVDVVPGRGTATHPFLLVNVATRDAVPAKPGRNLD